jgi:hypothetical protein
VAGSDIPDIGLRLSELEPKDWFVVFSEHTDKWWIRCLARGKYKHVSCFGYVDRAYSWVFYDFYLDRARVMLVGDHEVAPILGYFSDMGTVVRMARPIGREAEVNIRSGWWCVPAVAHIIGLKSCALRPDALFRQCLANGGEIIGGRNESEEPSS